jgi:hypothetical protein
VALVALVVVRLSPPHQVALVLRVKAMLVALTQQVNMGLLVEVLAVLV